jgi:hypothetical protein
MVLRAIIFALIAYGLTAVIAFVVAVVIKLIALIVQRADHKATADNASS